MLFVEEFNLIVLVVSIPKVQQYKDDLIEKAETLITVGFPEKIVQLNEILATDKFANRSFQDVFQALNIPIPEPIALNHDGEVPAKRARTETNNDVAMGEPSGSKVFALPNGKVPCNAHICELIKIVKPVIRALVEDTNLLKMWISFMIPKVRSLLLQFHNNLTLSFPSNGDF